MLSEHAMGRGPRTRISDGAKLDSRTSGQNIPAAKSTAPCLFQRVYTPVTTTVAWYVDLLYEQAWEFKLRERESEVTGA